MTSIEICLDIGSYDGRDALRLQNLYKTKVYAFEPHPTNFGNTVMNTRFNKEIEVLPYAVSDSDEKFIILNESRGPQSHSILPFKSESELLKSWGECYAVRPSGHSYTVPLTRLDNFFVSKGYTPESLSILHLHVDAQGADLEVLKSLGSFLARVRSGRVEAVKTPELSSYQGQLGTNEKVIEFLRGNGFLVTEVSPNSGILETSQEFNISFVKE